MKLIPPPPNVYLRFPEIEVEPLEPEEPPSTGITPNTVQYVITTWSLVATPALVNLTAPVAIGTAISVISGSNGGTVSNLSLQGSARFGFSGTEIVTTLAVPAATYTLTVSGSVSGTVVTPITVTVIVASAVADLLLLANGSDFLNLANATDELQLAN